MFTGYADMPLVYRTPPGWAAAVLRDSPALLNDHAHLEKKAAANALELLNRYPAPNLPTHDAAHDDLTSRWVTTMTAVARDEIEHLAAVLRILHRRGGRFTSSHRNPYAKALRDLVRQGDGPRELMDRLMISALIEARSCERFRLLADHCEDRELAKLYAALHASEHGHYLVFIDLARAVCDADEVEPRWQWMLVEEARIIASQPAGPAMHSGIA